MAVLEALVIATLILAGAWVGYNYWEHSLTEDPYGDAEAHDIGQPDHPAPYGTAPPPTPALRI
ncbi:MAG: hypothetical protein J4G04_07840 [Nitrosopumilaceae archaeon]|nr:hypothetical protein [Nitrosopumilaceae archaeon]